MGKLFSSVGFALASVIRGVRRTGIGQRNRGIRDALEVRSFAAGTIRRGGAVETEEHVILRSSRSSSSSRRRVGGYFFPFFVSVCL